MDMRKTPEAKLFLGYLPSSYLLQAMTFCFLWEAMFQKVSDKYKTGQTSLYAMRSKLQSSSTNLPCHKSEIINKFLCVYTELFI